MRRKIVFALFTIFGLMSIASSPVDSRGHIYFDFPSYAKTIGTLSSTSLGAAGSGTESTTITIPSTSIAHVHIEELVDNLFERVNCSVALENLYNISGGYGSDVGIIQNRNNYPFNYFSGSLQTGLVEIVFTSIKYYTVVFSEAVPATEWILSSGPDFNDRMPVSGTIEWSADGSTSWTEAAAFSGLSWSADEIKSIDSWSSVGAKKGWRIKFISVASGINLRLYPQIRILDAGMWMGEHRANGLTSGIVWEQTNPTTITIRNTNKYARSVRAYVTN